ncbi:glycoside hydrolase family 65 protein [Halochromatium salexigens]|uniref:Trehalose 6-phosphate phosphorylase n=1 Tax=Halochromatium salexigens TaxID=49447 RepID=A0AAJ0UHN0_HALSE|nr:trehalose 6-phosphate phosphorylase [Halochromatium salexigens]
MHDWEWSYHDYRPEQERLREALCTVGNGYFASRGAAPESVADTHHYPGTYLAGGYDRAKTEIQGRMVENEDLVNLPNWLPLRLRFADGDWFNPDQVELLDYRQTLDLRNAVLERLIRFREPGGRETQLRQRRLVHMEHQHLAGLETELTPCNWSGSVEVLSALDGRVTNDGVERYRGLEGDHLECLETQAVDVDGLYLKARTRQSRLEIAMSARTRAYRGEQPIDLDARVETEADQAKQRFQLHLDAGQTVSIEKLIALYTSRDAAISEYGLEARSAIASLPRFAALQESNALIWQQLWRRFDLELGLRDDDDGRTAAILRLHLFHLLVTASPRVMDLDAGVPARGLHGEAYRGHIFWDELFIFPTLNLRLPEITRSLLMYRYRRLGAARQAAREAGLRGAMYPWQSGSNGREESQTLHLNPRSGHWTPDESRLQRHVSSAIAYNLWQYYETSGDQEFLSFYGAEMLLEIARFWASIATYNQALERYEIHGVIGPDEFHTGYPDREEPGLSNHAYTNVMACWVLCRALDLPEHLPNERWDELREQLGIQRDELEQWDRISRRLRLCFHDQDVISQFEGFDQLKELDWQSYRERYGDIQRLDRILEAEGDSPNRYQATKQADVLMLFYLFSTEELERLLTRLGYPFHPEMIPRNVDYYGSRTSHGSTLSRVVDAWVLARRDRQRSWSLFTEALESDVADIQGGTTSEGIHLGAMAGTVDLIQRCYAGIEVRDQRLWLNPALPEELQRLRIRLRFRGQTLELDVSHERVRVRAISPETETIRLWVGSQACALRAGETHEFERKDKPAFVEAP